MARAYSQDLRDRVIDAGSSARAAADRFGIGIGIATIVWTRRAREGERSARKQDQPKRGSWPRPACPPRSGSEGSVSPSVGFAQGSSVILATNGDALFHFDLHA